VDRPQTALRSGGPTTAPASGAPARREQAGADPAVPGGGGGLPRVRPAATGNGVLARQARFPRTCPWPSSPVPRTVRHPNCRAP
jgi:hypothetical protein